MKKSFFFAVATAVALVSCNKEVAGPELANGNEKEITLSVVVPEVASKATSVTSAGEKTVNTLQVYVFRDDANKALDACGMESGNGVNIKCSTGNRKIYALVNAPDIRSSVSCEADLLASTTLLSDNTSATNLVMVGNVDKVLTVPGETVSIEVKRVASSIEIKKITTSFISQALKEGTFTIKGIYLLNVNGKNNYALNAPTSEESFWYNRLNKNTNSFATAGIVSDLNMSEVVSESKAYDKPHTFYAYPNSHSYLNNGTWSLRATMLCVETEFTAKGSTSGTTYYYPIAIENIESNKKYIIPELVVTRLGSLDPSTEVTFSDCTFSVTVKDWDENYLSTETI